MDRKKDIELAKEAEKSGRFNDACKHMKAAILKNAQLSEEERAVFSKAYKGFINHILLPGETPRLRRSMRETNSTQVVKISEEVVKLMEDYMIPNADNGKSKVFSQTMKGEYLKYMAEVTTGEIRHKNAEVALSEYRSAEEVARDELVPTDPVRLSVAKAAFDDAVEELEALGEDSYKDSTTIMQELRENLTRWTMSNEEKVE